MPNNFKLYHKIGGGFVLLIFLASLIMLIAWTGNNALLERVNNSNDVNKMVKDIKEARKIEKNYIIEPGNEYIEELKVVADNIRSQAKATQAMFKDSYNIKQMDQVIASTDNYEESFNNYVALENEKEIAEKNMVESAKKLETAAVYLRRDEMAQFRQARASKAGIAVLDDKLSKAEDANTIIKFLLEIRRNEKDYLLTLDSKELEKINKNTQQMMAVTRNLHSRLELAGHKEQTSR